MNSLCKIFLLFFTFSINVNCAEMKEESETIIDIQFLHYRTTDSGEMSCDFCELIQVHCNTNMLVQDILPGALKKLEIRLSSDEKDFIKIDNWKFFNQKTFIGKEDFQECMQTKVGELKSTSKTIQIVFN